MSGQRGEGFARLEKEIAGEKAAALGRAGERLEEAIAEAHRIAASVREARDAESRRRLLRAYDEARGRARRARMALLIQREAVGLRHHAIVEQQFPEPPSEP